MFFGWCGWEIASLAGEYMGQVPQIELVEPCFFYDHMSEGRHSYQHPFTSYFRDSHRVPRPRVWTTQMGKWKFAVEVNACQVLLHKLDSSQDNVVQKVDTQKVAVDNLLNSITGAI